MNLVNPMAQPSEALQGSGFQGAWIETPRSPQWSETSGLRFVALQPIFDLRRSVIGYEALSRSGWGNRFEGDSDEATERMVDDCVSHGLTGLTGGLPIFLNCTRESLLSGILSRLPRSTVLELLETIVPDRDVLQACRQLKTQGFRIALDDFRPSDEMREIVGLADFIKVDFRLSDKAERRRIRRFANHAKAIFIAEKIETPEEFQEAHRESFKLFQGYLLARPAIFARPSARIAA
jgi:c-di-GMP-related signal transduction protein